jgi:hypothetical protein
VATRGQDRVGKSPEEVNAKGGSANSSRVTPVCRNGLFGCANP